MIITTRTRKQWVGDTILLVAVVVVSCLYFLLNTPHEVVTVLRTIVDDSIPRVPVFAIPYLVFLPWFWGIVIYSWLKKSYFHQLAYSVIIVNLIAFVVYLTFQTNVPREVVMSNDFFSGVLKFIYSSDQAYGCFPSLHSALSAVAATYLVIRKSKWAWAAVAMAGLIVISTLFTKQHYVLDAVSGVGLGVLVTWGVFRLFLQRKHRRDSTQ